MLYDYKMKSGEIEADACGFDVYDAAESFAADNELKAGAEISAVCSDGREFQLTVCSRRIVCEVADKRYYDEHMRKDEENA